jgi:hypothetical protein
MLADEQQTELQEKQAKPPRKKMVHARLIAHKGAAALVEYIDGGFKRCYIPLAEFDAEKAQADEAVLKAGVPYGVDWSRVELKQLDPLELDQELKRRGLWTLEDIREHPEQAHAAINKISNATRIALVEAAQAQTEKE